MLARKYEHKAGVRRLATVEMFSALFQFVGLVAVEIVPGRLLAIDTSHTAQAAEQRATNRSPLYSLSVDVPDSGRY